MILYANTLTQTHTHNSNNETNNSECLYLQQQQTYDPKSTLIIFESFLAYYTNKSKNYKTDVE